ELNLKNEILHNLGHVAGLEHCVVGDTAGMCISKLGSDWTELEKEDVMYKFPIFPIGLVGCGECEPEENEVSEIKSPTSKDVGKLQSLYGKLELPFPTDGKYALDEGDMEDIISYMHFENITGVFMEGGRQRYSNGLKSAIAYSQKRSKKNIQEQYDKFYEKVKRQTSMFDLDNLKVQRSFLTVGIYNGVRIKQDRINGYHDLDLGFIENGIQKYLELRNITIDAIGGR
ncbi:MAG: hypothetical protein KDK90_27730, partial [Leptospiraceae bacterium]|nr:hypothetical protein [Leptospiraceae bacterium]